MLIYAFVEIYMQIFIIDLSISQVYHLYHMIRCTQNLVRMQIQVYANGNDITYPIKWKMRKCFISYHISYSPMLHLVTYSNLLMLFVTLMDYYAFEVVLYVRTAYNMVLYQTIARINTNVCVVAKITL